ncbi:hypothetical protein [Sphingomonas sp. 3-13AW]|uniref:hypothetical protein n=1 Tax=Sphingomonas sp. 3-13AW TaxID=3050450 RepID=UPI003BB63D92
MQQQKRGRRSKAERYAKAAKVIGPLGVQVLFEGFPGEKAMPLDEEFEGDLENRFGTLGKMVKKRLDEVVKKEEKKEIFGQRMPWLTADTPEQELIDLSQRRHLNERVLNELLSEVAMHMLLSMKIEADMKQARRTALDEALRVPKGLQEFILRLHLAGLKATAVKDLSTGAIDALVALLNGDADPDLLDAVGLRGKGSRITDEEVQQALADAERARAEYHRAREEAFSESLPPVIEPVIPEGFSEEWDYSKGPLPPEYWSTVQTFPIPYEWEYRMALPEEEESVLGMPLPEAHSWNALFKWDRDFEDLALDPIISKRGSGTNIREYTALRRDIDPDDVDANLVKTWHLLLAGRLMTQEECDDLFQPGYFEGVVMPCPATGPGVVRQLVRKGE